MKSTQFFESFETKIRR